MSFNGKHLSLEDRKTIENNISKRDFIIDDKYFNNDNIKLLRE